MDNFFALCISALVFAGVVFLSFDFRHFSQIENDCRTLGYVQNSTTRITCSVDLKPKMEP